jgi:molecular chaperone GrpE
MSDDTRPEDDLESPPETEAPADPVAALSAENAALKDQALRAIAEMDNLRKRQAREVAETRQYAIAGFARDMLTATDNLARALSALSEEERTAAEGTLKTLIDGVELTEREMQRLLQKHGIEKIAAKGEKFDPHMHQAMFELEAGDGVADGTVVEVVQDGYAIGERVLRPAFVGVARRRKGADPAPAEGVDKTV